MSDKHLMKHEQCCLAPQLWSHHMNLVRWRSRRMSDVRYYPVLMWLTLFIYLFFSLGRLESHSLRLWCRFTAWHRCQYSACRLISFQRIWFVHIHTFHSFDFFHWNSIFAFRWTPCQTWIQLACIITLPIFNKNDWEWSKSRQRNSDLRWWNNGITLRVRRHN